MNNRYIFRGKRKDNGEWVEGYLIQGNKTYIATTEAINYMVVSTSYMASIELVEVIPETVGQCTGLKDKNGKLIFEGDIIKINSRVASSETRETAETEIGFVEYDIDECEYRITHVNGTIPEYGKNYSLNLWRFKRDTNEAIGNIHDDNPELLEVER